jgi:hypothetical protein
LLARCSTRRRGTPSSSAPAGVEQLEVIEILYAAADGETS